MIRAHTIIY